jgi:hypothetical protein
MKTRRQKKTRSRFLKKRKTMKRQKGGVGGILGKLAVGALSFLGKPPQEQPKPKYELIKWPPPKPSASPSPLVEVPSMTNTLTTYQDPSMTNTLTTYQVPTTANTEFYSSLHESMKKHSPFTEFYDPRYGITKINQVSFITNRISNTNKQILINHIKRNFPIKQIVNSKMKKYVGVVGDEIIDKLRNRHEQEAIDNALSNIYEDIYKKSLDKFIYINFIFKDNTINDMFDMMGKQLNDYLTSQFKKSNKTTNDILESYSIIFENKVNSLWDHLLPQMIDRLPPEHTWSEYH